MQPVQTCTFATLPHTSHVSALAASRSSSRWTSESSSGSAAAAGSGGPRAAASARALATSAATAAVRSLTFASRNLCGNQPVIASTARGAWNLISTQRKNARAVSMFGARPSRRHCATYSAPSLSVSPDARHRSLSAALAN